MAPQQPLPGAGSHPIDGFPIQSMLVHPALNLLGAGQIVLAFPLHPQGRQLFRFWQRPIGQHAINAAFPQDPIEQAPAGQISPADPMPIA
jgi:hypothetical protein